jgi:hypothetical protein
LFFWLVLPVKRKRSEILETENHKTHSLENCLNRKEKTSFTTSCEIQYICFFQIKSSAFSMSSFLSGGRAIFQEVFNKREIDRESVRESRDK